MCTAGRPAGWALRMAMVTVAALCATSCNKPAPEPGPDTTVSLSLGRESVAAAPADVVWARINTAPDSTWSIWLQYQSDDSDWATVTPASGKGPNSQVQINYLANTSDVSRSVNVILTSGGITVTRTIVQAPGSGTTIPPVVPPDGTENPSPPQGTLTGWVELPSTDVSHTTIANPSTNTEFVAHFASVVGAIKRNYSMLYDKTQKISYWVAYPLSTSYIGSGRSDAWAYDPYLPASVQPTLFRGYKEYNSNLTGYDRGHQIPSADRVSDPRNSDPKFDANMQTFYFTNMTPQVSKLNQTLWAALEDKVVRATVTGGLCDTLYVVTGAVLRTVGGNETVTYAHDNNNDPVAVPNYYFKVLVQRTGNSYTAGIGFWMPNTFLSATSVSSQYAKTIRQIEALTGFDFFTNLSAADQNTVETQLNYSKWKGIVVQ